ncbi:MAG: hypothetical protein EZS26_003461 [Candidatus Ordinivivax streblomastigis]|uniref:BT-3987-like N-terminal domain-containing protein n=1 Tax=Candidatus Ordinivivax streblomastigis TaxID=2540710 RepID=A0A5M8NVK9_9BACT|nr:MAG: hypothetical protein EZS26_003461 [Candidatus Ordinivivax streblomastigis]
MKNYLLKFTIGVIGGFALYSCGKLDYENKEFYKQEVYIINAKSTAAAERLISNMEVFTFADTLRILNDDYDTELVHDARKGIAYVNYKIGLGGSLPAQEDLAVRVQFDQEAVDDYNTERNTELYIPDKSLYSVNVPYDETEEAFTVIIPKGESSSALIFTIPLDREQINEYAKFAFPMKIVSCEKAPLSRQYTSFMVASLVINFTQETDWSGFPIPRIPEGRYHSARLQSNVQENMSNNIQRVYKYITRLGDTPELANQFTIWGTGVWSFENQGYWNNAFMYNRLYLNDSVRGTYTMEPVRQTPDYPWPTFNYSTTQGISENNKYDPKTKTLTLYYKNVIREDYIDILTYVGDDPSVYDGKGIYGEWLYPTPVGAGNRIVLSWEQLRSTGYTYWLPIATE